MLVELLGRQVDGNVHRLRPGRRLYARLADHPFADWPDQPDLLGHEDELGRRDHAAFRMVPADQRLEDPHTSPVASPISGW